MANRILEEIRQTRPFATLQEEAVLNIVRTADALKRDCELLFRRHGITSAQYNVLRILRGAGDRGMHCSAIAERMITAEPDITRLLMRMDRLGLLVRHRNTADRRMVTAIATDRGFELLDELAAPLRELQEQQFVQLSEVEIEVLVNGLEKVREGVARIP